MKTINKSVENNIPLIDETGSFVPGQSFTVDEILERSLAGLPVPTGSGLREMSFDDFCEDEFEEMERTTADYDVEQYNKEVERLQELHKQNLGKQKDAKSKFDNERKSTETQQTVSEDTEIRDNVGNGLEQEA